jgi:hypothetical protein
VIFALSVHDFIDKVGAYVGFASAIGLALFALLLFSQARELKRLREWGAQAHDRIGELERRLAAALELARRANAPQRTMAPSAAAQRTGTGARPAPARPALARTSSPMRLPLLPAAPVGVGGPSLGSATAFVPLPKQLPGAASAGAPVPAAAPTPSVVTPASAPSASPPPAAIPAAAASAASASPAVPVRATPAPVTAAAQGPAQPATTPAPAPPTPAPPPAPPAGTNGHSDTFPPVPPVRRPAPPGAGRRVPSRGPARPPAGATRASGRPAPAAAPLRARGPATATPRAAGSANGSGGAPHSRRLTLLLAGLGVIAVAAIAVIVISGNGSNSPSQSPTGSGGTPAQQTGGGSGTTQAAAPAHDRITVAVLNGTTTAGLASTIASRLTADGFVQGAVTNASDQQRSVTVVSYFGGHEREAQEVAKTLNVPSDAVQPIDADTEQACGQGGTCTAIVVVTVGADRQ